MIHHVYVKGNSDHVIILLHGTGGNEHDLLTLSNYIDQDATKIGIRGRILESGMPRYFKRLSPGIFDTENLIEETHWLKKTIESLCDQYELNDKKLHVLGYSNGANIASSLNFHYPQLFLTSLLFHPMLPFETFDYPPLKHQNIFIAAGKNDPIVPHDQTLELASTYQKFGANVEVFWSYSGHQITQASILEAHQFFEKTKK
jgi:phospholipase/carboxylesterase